MDNNKSTFSIIWKTLSHFEFLQCLELFNSLQKHEKHINTKNSPLPPDDENEDVPKRMSFPDEAKVYEQIYSDPDNLLICHENSYTGSEQRSSCYGVSRQTP